MPKDKISEEIREGWRRMKPCPNPNEEAHSRFMTKHSSNMKTVEVSFSVDEEFLSALQTRIGATSVVDVLQEALALLDWASRERDKGKFVLATSEHVVAKE